MILSKLNIIGGRVVTVGVNFTVYFIKNKQTYQMIYRT